MQDKLVSSRLALDQRTAQLEQVFRRCAVFFAKIPLERWKWLAILILVIWLSHSLARLFWLLMPAPDVPPAAVATLVSPANRTSNDSESVNVAVLKELNIFGKMDEAVVEQTNATAAPVIENEAVDTQLNLVLRGVIGSNNEASARAIIANGAEADVYGPGDELPAGRGVTLAKVMDLRVILNNNGRYESLWLYQEDPNTRASIATPYVPDVGASRGGYDRSPNDQPQPQYTDAGSGYDSSQSGPINSADPTAEVSRTLSDVVAMSIHREGGQVVGYKIRPGRNAEQFTALGLQADDIVTAVNGVPLTSPGKVMEIYKNMSNATSASLEIKRGGSVLSVDVVLQ